MSERRNDADATAPVLDPDERAFVERLAAAYRAPELAPSRRVAFRESLDQRLAKDRRTRAWKGALGVALAALACVVVWNGLPAATSPQDATFALEPEAVPATTVAAEVDATPEEALLSLAYEPLAEEATTLPEDYEAIASLFLGS